MRILCVIDHFGSGGAQRQMVNLACALKSRGHEVEIFIYFPEYDFVRGILESSGIVIHESRKGRGFSMATLCQLAMLLKDNGYDGAISFLSSPSIYLELASLFSRKTVILTSERSSHYGDKSRFFALVRRAFHVLSDCVVTNSISHANWLSRYPWLRGKIHTIYNGYRIPDEVSSVVPASTSDLRLIAIGRVGPEKNCISLIQALDIFYQKHGFCPRVSWVGRRDMSDEGMHYWKRIQAAFESYPIVRASWSWLGERTDIFSLIGEHHALIHPALYEGLPNVICEALICGKPVLASDVCDHPILVQKAVRGYLFDPDCPESISSAMEAINSMDSEGWKIMGRNSRDYGIKNLSIDILAASYESVIENLVGAK